MKFGRSDRQHKYEASRTEDNSVIRDIALVVAGLGLGSTIALLTAPDSGEEVRHAIGRRYQKTMKRLGRSTENLRERVEDLLDQASELRSSRLRRFLRRRAMERLREVG